MKSIQEIINSLFGISNDSSAPIIITLLVFICGYITNGVYRYIINSLQRRNSRKLINNMINEIIRSCLVQDVQFRKFVKKINIKNIKTYSLNTVPINHLENFNRLEHKEIYEAYFNGHKQFCAKKRLHAFNKLGAMISRLNFWGPKLIIEMNEFNSKYNMHLSMWNESLEKFRQTAAILTQQVNGQHLKKELLNYFQPFDSISVNWQKQPDYTNIFTTMTYLVDPILALNREHRNLDFVLELNNHLLAAKGAFENIKSTFEYYHDTFTSYIFTYRYVRRMLKVCINIMNN